MDGGPFLTTRWSLVRAAGSADEPAARGAWSTLCETYWPPLYAFARRSGLSTADAADAVQSFLLQRFERRDLDPAGDRRFRSYLLGALQHFLANERRAAARDRRGGGTPLVDLDAAERGYLAEPADRCTPERQFERRWAVALLGRALAAVQTDYAARGRGPLFAVLQPFLDGSSPGERYRELAATCGLDEGAFKVAVHRARQRFAAAVRQEVADTLLDPADIDDELLALRRALAPD